METVNIGMTFYGGVSLAVYEAGVAEEFLRFIQYCDKQREENTSAIPDVKLKVISGSSAGGLAAILMSAAYLNAQDPSSHINEMRRIWLDVADISNLQYKGGQNIRSFLNNDILETEIAGFLQLPSTTPPPNRDLTIYVTGTNMQGYFDAVPIESDFVNTSKYADRAFLTTRHTEVFTFDEGKIRGAIGNDTIRQDIAKAARITSSFPAAFPPQLTDSPSLSGNNVAKFWYFDGGVLDNKPLGHAIDYIEASSADGQWWYFFVEPDPDDDSDDNTRKKTKWSVNPDDPPDPIQTLLTVLNVKMAETICDDLKRLQRINHQSMQIKSLVQQLWHTLCKNIDSSQGCSEMLTKFIEDLKTARLHKHLPDYLKCVTMLKYRFVKKATLGKDRDVETEHAKVIEILRPFDYIDMIYRFTDNIVDESNPEFSRLKDLIEEDISKDINELFLRYNAKVTDIKKIQLDFRQITFWIEKDYKDKSSNELSSATWNEFIKARVILIEALTQLNGIYEEISKELIKILDKNLKEKIDCYVILDESLRNASGVNVDEPINVVKIYHDKKTHGKLAGAALGHFSGFLDRDFRKNDYLMGKLDTRQMLEGKLGIKKGFDGNFWPGYKTWLSIEEQKIVLIYSLDKLKIDNLPVSEVIPPINSLLKTFSILIKKYKEKPFFEQLYKFKANIALIPLRLLLWLIKLVISRN
ncbi:MAG: DUF3376 domain-containing protein [Nitrospirae bacterium]|nr:DUF3376 domain-containing protein [Nitrospirota bacterium]